MLVRPRECSSLVESNRVCRRVFSDRRVEQVSTTVPSLPSATPLDNKSRTWSNRFLHKLTVVAHPARLEQLHFQHDFLKKTSRLFFLLPPILHPKNSAVMSFVSNSVQHLAVFMLQLHLRGGSNSIPEAPRLCGSGGSRGDPDDDSGDTEGNSQAFPLFLNADRKHVPANCHNSYVDLLKYVKVNFGT